MATSALTNVGPGALDDILDVNTAGVAAGYKLTYSSGLWVPAVERGVDNNYDPSWSTANALDQEFNATSSSLPSGWSWVNQGGAAYSEAYGMGTISRASQAGDNNYLIVQSLSGAPSTWTAKCKLTMNGKPFVDFFDAQMVIRDSSTGKFYGWLVRRQDALRLFAWNSPTSFSAATSGPYNIPYPSTFYLAIRKNSSTSYDFGFSMDGVNYRYVDTARNITSFVATPDTIGFGMLNAAGDDGAVSCHWFRLR